MHESRLANLLGAAALNLSEKMTGAAATAAGVSTSGAAALVTLAEFPGLGVTELGNRIGLSQPACARMLDQLAGQGLVERQTRSGRSVSVVLTEPGEQAAHRALRARDDELASVLRHVPDEQRAGLGPALESLLRGLHEEFRSAERICRLCDHASCTAHHQRCPVGQSQRDRDRPRSSP